MVIFTNFGIDPENWLLPMQQASHVDDVEVVQGKSKELYNLAGFQDKAGKISTLSFEFIIVLVQDWLPYPGSPTKSSISRYFNHGQYEKKWRIHAFPKELAPKSFDDYNMTGYFYMLI